LAWKARLADQLGFFSFEPVKLLGTSLYGIPAKLAALVSSLTVLHDCLAANEANEKIFEITERFIDDLSLTSYANWERELLRELGFELCLDKCNATGVREDLCYISPKTGHAVCRTAGELYKDVLLPLPKMWAPAAVGGCVKEALEVLEYFYRKRIYSESGKDYPFIRTSLAKYADIELKKAA
jgi:DNA repair protein RecO (recombination protein O)